MVHVSGPSLDQLDDRGDRFAADIRRTIARIVNITMPKVGDINDLAIIRTHWTSAVNDALIEHLRNAWVDSADDTYGKLIRAAARVTQTQPQQSQPVALTAAFLVPKVVSRLAELFLESAINRLVSIGDLVWNVARQQMLIGMQAGESITEIRHRLMKTTELASPRAEVIARTEVIGASNAGSYAEMKATGLNATKEWIATTDSRTRPSHEHIDGEEVGIDDKFIVGGYAMSYPHDPTGPPQETISCRCTLGWDIPDEEFLMIDGEPLAAAATAFHLRGRHDQKDHGRKGLRGLKAGKSLKITHGLVHKKQADGSIIAVTKDGKKHILWEGNKYHLREKDDNGLWQTKKTVIKSKAYKEISDFASDWHEPDQEKPGDKKTDDGDKKVTTDKKTTPTPAAAPTPVATDTASGASLKITHGLIHKKHADGTTIAVNKNGDKKVTWNGKSYDLDKKQADGSWKTEKTAIKSKAYKEVNDFDSAWHEPVAKGDDTELPSTRKTPAPAVKSVKSAATTLPNDVKYIKPGKQINLDQQYLDTHEFPDDSVIAISTFGTKKITAHGDKISFHHMDAKNKWVKNNETSMSDAQAAIDKADAYWHEPVAVSVGTPKSDKKSLVPAATPKPVASNTGVASDAVAKITPIPMEKELIEADKPLKIIDALSGDVPEYSTIAVTKDGNYRVVSLNGKYFEVQKNKKVGGWGPLTSFEKGDEYSDIVSLNKEWYTPKLATQKTKTVPSTSPMTAGEPIDITQDMFKDVNFPPKTVLAVNEDGTKRIMRSWNDTIAVQEWNAEFGVWTGSQWLTDGKEAEEVSKLNIKWHAPVETGSKATAPSAPGAPNVSTPKSTPTAPSKTIDKYAPVEPGRPITLAQEFFFQNYPANSTIAITPDGKTKIAWGNNGKYEILELDEKSGTWFVTENANQYGALAMAQNFSIEWHEPENASPSSINTPGNSSTSTKSANKLKHVYMGNKALLDQPVTLTQATFEDSYPSGSVIAMNAFGTYQLTREGGKFKIRANDGKGNWIVVQESDKDGAFKMADSFAADWWSVKTDVNSVTENYPVSAPSAPSAPSGPKTFTPFQKAYVQSIFGSNGVKWHTDTKKIYDAALEVSKKDSSLSMADALDIMDQSLLKKTDNPFATKMNKFLSTKAGMKYAQEKGGSAPVGSVTPSVAAASKSSVNIPKSNLPAKNLTKASATNMQQRMDLLSPPPWTAAQRAALKNYTGGSYTEINKCARGTGACSPATIAKIKQIKAAMKPSTENIKLYRKTNLATFGVTSNEQLEALAGKTIRDDGVISTSIVEGTWSGQVHLKIEAPAGSKMAWVQPISHYPNENEFVLAPGTEFEVISVEPHWSEPNQRVMKVRIVPGSGTP